MARPFPTLSRTPTPASWKEELIIDPTIRSPFHAGYILSRSRHTITPRKFSFRYNLLTQADKNLIVDFEQHVRVGADKFDFRNPITNEDWEVRLLSPIRISVEPRDYTKYSADMEIFGKEVQKMRVANINIPSDLGEGLGFTDIPIFVNPKAVTLNSIGILTQGAPAGIDDSNTCVLTIADDADNTIATKTYNTAIQPPDEDYADLGNLSNQSLLAGEHLTLTLTEGDTVFMPSFDLIVEYYYT